MGEDVLRSVEDIKAKVDTVADKLTSDQVVYTAKFHEVHEMLRGTQTMRRILFAALLF